MAINATFATVELLEQILAELAFEDIWRCKRVSKTWQTVTKTSPILQQKLFLRPEGAPIKPATQPHLWRSPRSRLDCYYDQPMRLNPLLLAEHDSITLLEQHFTCIRIPNMNFHCPRGLDKATFDAMFLTQPPIIQLLRGRDSPLICDYGITIQDCAAYIEACLGSERSNYTRLLTTADVEGSLYKPLPEPSSQRCEGLPEYDLKDHILGVLLVITVGFLVVLLVDIVA